MGTQRQQPHPAGRHTGGNAAQPALPPVRYFEDAGKSVLRSALVNEEAEQVAKLIKDGVRNSQLRRFYENVCDIERRLGYEAVRRKLRREELFVEFLPEFKMLRAKAYYAAKRKVIPSTLCKFFENHVAAVSNYRDFEAFLKHFQAVVAFHRYHGKE